MVLANFLETFLQTLRRDEHGAVYVLCFSRSVRFRVFPVRANGKRVTIVLGE